MPRARASQPIVPELPGRHAHHGLSQPALAGLLIWAVDILARLRLPHPGVTEILRATGARKSQSYARRTQIQSAVAAIDRGQGRPHNTPPVEITHRVLGFVMQHPGAVCHGGTRRRYSASFRRFVLELRAQFPDVGEACFARAVQVPPACLRAWRQRSQPPSSRQRGPVQPAAPAAPASVPKTGPAADVLRAYLAWCGSLGAFCEHVRSDLGIPWKRGTIARLLEDHGLRAPVARTRRTADSIRGGFRTFFPGAQWVADGSELTVRINGEPHRFNLELVVDAQSGAIAGAALGDCEDSEALVDAFRDAVATTGTQPLSLLVDRRPCNLTAEVARGIAGTTRLHAGRGRPQSKGHVEGAFGLFAQNRPRLEITAGSQRELAREVLRLMVQCWARTLNQRPRRRRGGRSRVVLCQATASPESVWAATRTIGERAARQERRRTGPSWMHARGSRAFLVHRLAKLGIADRDELVIRALGEHPFEAVLAGMAIYQGKRAAGTLPDSADGRYLIGITRRIAENDEGVHIAEALWRTRTAARAHLLRWLVDEHRGATAQPDPAQTPEHIVDRLVDNAVTAATQVERRLWMAALADAINRWPGAVRMLYRRAACRIHASAELSYSEQLVCVRALAAEIVPMAA